MPEDDVLARIRHARDRVLEQEQLELDRISSADNAEEQRAAGVRLATRQAVREAFDDILGESSEQPTSKS